MLLHPHTPRPSQGWGATKVDLEVVLHSPSTGIMGDRLRHSTLHQQVNLYSCIWIVSQITSIWQGPFNKFDVATQQNQLIPS